MGNSQFVKNATSLGIGGKLVKKTLDIKLRMRIIQPRRWKQNSDRPPETESDHKRIAESMAKKYWGPVSEQEWDGIGLNIARIRVRREVMKRHLNN